MNNLQQLLEKVKQAPLDDSRLEEELLNTLYNEAYQIGGKYSLITLSKLKTYEVLKKTSPDFKIRFLKTLLKSNTKEYKIENLKNKLLSRLLQSKIELQEIDFNFIFNYLKGGDGNYMYSFPYKPFLSQIRKFGIKHGVSTSLKTQLQDFKIKSRWGDEYLNKEDKLINDEIDAIICDDTGSALYLKEDGFGEIVNDFLKTLAEPENNSWSLIIQYLLKDTRSSAPSKKWIKTSNDLLSSISKEDVIKQFNTWLKHTGDIFKRTYKLQEQLEIGVLNEGFIKNMIWASAFYDDPRLNKEIEEVGIWGFKKIRGFGPISKKIANSCIHTFSILPQQNGVGALIKFREKINYPSVKQFINRKLYQLAERENRSMEELEEMGVSDYGLNNKHELIQSFGEFKAKIIIEDIKSVRLVWIKSNGKVQKTIPALIKDQYKEEIKTLKKNIKNIKEALSVHKDRIEQFYLHQRSWNYTEWFERYIQHSLVGFIGKQLIWVFEKEEQLTPAFYFENQWIDSNGKTIDWIDKNTSVSLWHPIHSTENEIVSWRNWLLNQEIQQAFKQAFREIYLLTDAEINTESYSNRYAAHILRQFQFAALCQARGWKYTLQGNWDSHNIPTLQIPKWNIRAEFWLETDQSEAVHSGIFNYIFTDQVRFYKDLDQLDMVDVPAIVFTEVMRDIDMFVSVTSIGNDPNWSNQGTMRHNNYWRDYSVQDLSANATTRKDILMLLIPRLKIKDRCSFTNKYLIVKGDIRTYKIHLGSGNILMEPHNEYLCIVPDQTRSKSNKVFLPFEGDRMLSIILSKAFLLADDKNIKDKTITRQIVK